MFEPVFMRLALVASIATGVSLGVMGILYAARGIPWTCRGQRGDARSCVRPDGGVGA